MLIKHNELKRQVYNDNFIVIDILTNLVRKLESANEFPDHYSIQVADHCLILAFALGIEKKHAYEIYMAAIIHNIGLFLSEEKPPNRVFDDLNESDKKKVYTIPWDSADIINTIPSMSNVSEMLYCHRERLDGSGYPNQVFGHMRKGRDYIYDKIIYDRFISIISCKVGQASRLEVK